MENLLNKKWYWQGLILGILSTFCLIISFGVLFLNSTSRKLTPDPHEVWAFRFLIFWPLNILSILFTVLAIKRLILIYSIRGKQSLLTILLLLSNLSFLTYELFLKT